MTDLAMRIESLLRRNMTGGDVPNKPIGEHTNLVRDLGFDSVQLMQLLFDLEIEFGISLYDWEIDMDQLTGFSSLCNLVSAHVEKAGAGTQTR